MEDLFLAIFPSIRAAQALTKLLFAVLAFLSVFDLFIDQSSASHATAFNCKRATVSLDRNLTHLLHHNYAYTLSYHAHIPVFVYLAQLLKSNEVVYSYDLTKNNSANLIYVKHDNKVYEVRCPKEIVTVINSPSCFANNIKPIIDSDGKPAFLDQNFFITNFATQVDCQQGPLKTGLFGKNCNMIFRK